MFLLDKPSPAQINAYLATQKERHFSYPEIGASFGMAPHGYNLDHYRARLGAGLKSYEAAKNAVANWKMFDFPWLQLCWPDAPIAEGTTVAVVVSHFGFWSMNSCRIVYVVNEEETQLKRFGFAYGTLDDHGERGEERFLVQFNEEDDSVLYEVLAFSRPNKMLANLGYPLTRILQKRFAFDSKQAMIRAVGQL